MRHHPDGYGPWTRTQPCSYNCIRSTAAYAGVAAVLRFMAVLALATLQWQDAVLSYVKGESLWSRARKKAVIALEDCAHE